MQRQKETDGTCWVTAESQVLFTFQELFFPDRNHAIIMPVMIFSVAAEQSCYHYKTQWFFRSAHKWFSSVSQKQNGHWQRTGDDSKTFEVQIKSESIKFMVNPHRIDCWQKLDNSLGLWSNLIIGYCIAMAAKTLWNRRRWSRAPIGVGFTDPTATLYLNVSAPPLLTQSLKWTSHSLQKKGCR